MSASDHASSLRARAGTGTRAYQDDEDSKTTAETVQRTTMRLALEVALHLDVPALVVPADLSDLDAVSALADAARDEFGRIAGVGNRPLPRKGLQNGFQTGLGSLGACQAFHQVHEDQLHRHQLQHQGRPARDHGDGGDLTGGADLDLGVGDCNVPGESAPRR